MTRRIAQISTLACIALAASAGGCDVSVDPPNDTPQGASASGSGAGSGSASAGSVSAASAGSGGSVESRCTETPEQVVCPYETSTLPGQAGVLRKVLWQVPLGSPPGAGFPVVILFQGSFNAPPVMFDGHADNVHGMYHLARTIKGLLDAGYAVLAPAAHAEGGLFWDTNIPPWSITWTSSPDHAFMLSILAAIPAGDFGPLDASRLYATGISSGGYMTSRMAVSYPGQFKALAVHSGSYATCSGSICAVPEVLPSDHPPTLFLHGEADLAVPIATMEAYDARLKAAGKETRVVTDPIAGHEWLPAGPDEVVGWFDSHP